MLCDLLPQLQLIGVSDRSSLMSCRYFFKHVASTFQPVSHTAGGHPELHDVAFPSRDERYTISLQCSALQPTNTKDKTPCKLKKWELFPQLQEVRGGRRRPTKASSYVSLRHSHAVCQLDLDASLVPPYTWDNMLAAFNTSSPHLPEPFAKSSNYVEKTRSDPLL